jgi:hypothetical protein
MCLLLHYSYTCSHLSESIIRPCLSPLHLRSELYGGKALSLCSTEPGFSSNEASKPIAEAAALRKASLCPRLEIWPGWEGKAGSGGELRWAIVRVHTFTRQSRMDSFCIPAVVNVDSYSYSATHIPPCLPVRIPPSVQLPTGMSASARSSIPS